MAAAGTVLMRIAGTKPVLAGHQHHAHGPLQHVSRQGSAAAARSQTKHQQKLGNAGREPYRALRHDGRQMGVGFIGRFRT